MDAGCRRDDSVSPRLVRLTAGNKKRTEWTVQNDWLWTGCETDSNASYPSGQEIGVGFWKVVLFLLRIDQRDVTSFLADVGEDKGLVGWRTSQTHQAAVQDGCGTWA